MVMFGKSVRSAEQSCIYICTSFSTATPRPLSPTLTISGSTLVQRYKTKLKPP